MNLHLLIPTDLHVEATIAKQDRVFETDGMISIISLIKFFGGIIEKLLVTTNRQDGNQENLRNAAYEAIMELMKNAPDDCYDIVLKVRRKQTIDSYFDPF